MAMIDPTHNMTPGAFEAMYEAYFSRVYNYIYYRVRNAVKAEDLTADVFVRAFEYRKSYDPDKGGPEAWLSGIARNAVNSYFRKNAGEPPVIELTELLRGPADTEDDVIQQEDRRQLLSLVRKLPKAHQELLALKYFSRLTNREIAKMTGLSESNVGTILHRVIEQLRKNFKEIS